MVSPEKLNQFFYIYKERYCKELAYVIMEVRIPSPAVGKLESQESQWHSSSLSPSPKAGEDQCPSLQPRVNSLLLSPFYYIQASTKLDKANPYWGGQPALLSLLIQVLFLLRYRDTPRKMFHQISGHSSGSVKLTHKINNYTMSYQTICLG